MNMKLLLFCVLLFVAASTFAQMDPSAECVIELGSEPRYSGLAAKAAIGAPPKSTFAMLADESYPTEDERQLISEWASAVVECGELGEEFRRANYPTPMLSLVNEAQYAFVELTVNLYNRKIPYGQFNRRRQALFEEVRTRATDIVQQLQERQENREVQRAEQQEQEEAQQRAQQRAQQQAEEARRAQDDANRRQAALYLLNQMRLNQVQPNVIVPYEMKTRPSTTTNCQRIGDSFNCISR